MKSPRKRVALVAIAVMVGVAVLAGCGTTTTTPQESQQSISDQIGNAATNARQYPLPQMKAGGWTERQLLTEHLLRQNDPKALRYVFLLSQTGSVIARWPIEGMVFDPNSQLTNTQNIESDWSNQTLYSGVVNSIGDNGTWGPEAGGAAFFTTNHVEVQLSPNALWIESDASLDITSAPQITLNANATPSTNHGQLPQK